MKKILLTCLMLIFPTYSHAQNAKQFMFSDGIERITTKFFPIVCEQDMPQIIDSIKKCYTNTFSANPDLPLGACLFADGYVSMVAKANKKGVTYPKEITDYINKYDERQKIFYEKLYNAHYNNIEDYNRDITNYIIALSYRMSISYTINYLSANPDIGWITNVVTPDPKSKKILLSSLKDKVQKNCKHNNFYYYAKDTHIP